MKLPQWIEEIRESSAFSMLDVEMLIKAFSIAWVALKAECDYAHTKGKHCLELAPVDECKCNKPNHWAIAEEAMRKIWELGK